MYMGKPELLNALLECKKESGTNAVLEKLIHEEKLGLRNAYREHEQCADEWKWHYSDYDSRWAKVVLDEVITDEEVTQFMEESWWHWYNPYEDGRDCTGVWFTTRMRVFRVDDKIIIYHFQGCDV